MELPGRGRRLSEALFTEMNSLTAEMLLHFSGYLDKPFAIFGHSMGALIGFELAKHLRLKYGKSPVHLFLSSHRAPHLSVKDEPFHTLPENEFVGKLQSLNGIPKEVLEHQELMTLMLPILRSDFTLCETYRITAAEFLDCPITAFGGLQDESVPKEDLLPWREYTSSRFSFQQFPGDHFYLIQSQALLIQTISDILSSYLVKTNRSV